MLIVTEPFGSYQKGQQITDAKEAESILASENSTHVVFTADAVEEPKAAEVAPTKIRITKED